jgi:glycosyltransferase involved in cell wall biosynthesis
MIPASPLVSVILPTYNRADTLGRSVSSVLEQTFDDLELIIVDDGSTDSTAVVVKKFLDIRIRYLRLASNRGASAARNAGIQQARGYYVAFQDSDDRWLPEKLERQLALLAEWQGPHHVVYSKYQRFGPSGPGRIVGEPFDRLRLLHHNFIGTPTIIANRECLARAHFDEQLPRRQDWELCLQLMQSCSFHFLDEVLVLSYITPASVTSSRSRLLVAYEYILEKHFALIRSSPRAFANFHYTIGLLYAERAEWSQARPHLIQAAVRWPFAVKHWARALASILGESVYNSLFSSRETGLS